MQNNDSGRKDFDSDVLLNYLRTKKIGASFLVTSDSGSWALLEKKNYLLLKQGKLDGKSPIFTDLINKGILITKNNLDNVVESYRNKKDFLFGGTSLHIIITTLRCDLKCKYCHASSRPVNEQGYDMDEKSAKEVVDLIFQSPSKQITIEFQGGEPTLNFEIIKFITSYAKEKNKLQGKDLLFTLVTNLSQMTKGKLDFLIDNEISICTSLDGPKELHNFNRGGYSSVVEWVNKINDEYNKRGITDKRLNALLTVTKDSLDKSKEIIDEYIKQGFDGIHLRSLNNLGCAKSFSTINYSAEEFIDFWTESMDYILEQNKSGKLFLERKTLIILKKLFDKFDPNYADLKSPCGAVIGQILYNYNGDIYTCDEGRMIGEDLFKIGVSNQTYKEVTTNKVACSIIAASVNDVHFCDKCAYKPFCGICPVLNYASSGSTITNIPSSDWCKVHKAQFDYIFRKINEDPVVKEIFLNWIKKER